MPGFPSPVAVTVFTAHSASPPPFKRHLVPSNAAMSQASPAAEDKDQHEAISSSEVQEISSVTPAQVKIEEEEAFTRSRKRIRSPTPSTSEIDLGNLPQAGALVQDYISSSRQTPTASTSALPAPVLPTFRSLTGLRGEPPSELQATSATVGQTSNPPSPPIRRSRGSISSRGSSPRPASSSSSQASRRRSGRAVAQIPQSVRSSSEASE